MSDIAKKKRGRKPKNLLSTARISNKEADTNIETEEPVKKGKRGRKPKQVYASINTVGNEDSKDDDTLVSSLSDDENVIVRLSVPDITNLTDDTEHPCAYNEQIYDNIFNVDDEMPDYETTKRERDTQNATQPKVINVLQDFEERNKNNEWPLQTSIACYWCCHRFNNAPIGIPINYNEGTFEVYGCFCSTHCAAAYNFNENTNQDEMWERYQLLNLLSRKMHGVPMVKSAPPRLSLKIFGGHLDIESFREHSKGNKFINVNFPPLTSVTQQLEEISDYEIFTDCKPLVDSKKSIESSMNLRFST